MSAELPDLRRSSGIIVAALAADTLGAEIDLQQSDVVHALNGKLIETLDNLRSDLKEISPGAPGVLQVERDGKLMYITFEVD